MLIDEYRVHAASADPILAMIAHVSGRPSGVRRLAEGVYEIGHFGSSHFLRGYDDSPEITINSYGVCDNYEQIIEQCPELDDPNRQFVITLTGIRKADEPSNGGWRWHKWGPYIGAFQPTTEYIHDEPEIEQVYVYHIYEKE